jgi:hypothetical protein
MARPAHPPQLDLLIDLIYICITKYNWNDQMRDDMGRVCSTHAGEEE